MKTMGHLQFGIQVNQECTHCLSGEYSSIRMQTVVDKRTLHTEGRLNSFLFLSSPVNIKVYCIFLIPNFKIFDHLDSFIEFIIFKFQPLRHENLREKKYTFSLFPSYYSKLTGELFNTPQHCESLLIRTDTDTDMRVRKFKTILKIFVNYFSC